jgi:hypothetical protein
VAVAVTGTLNRAGEWIGKQIATIRYGKEQVEVAEKIEKQTAETLATMEKRKKKEEEFKKVTEDIRRIKEQQAEADLKALTNQERVNKLTNDLADMEKAAASFTGEKLEARKMELEIEEKKLKLSNALRDLDKEREAEADKAADKKKKKLEEIASIQERNSKAEFEAAKNAADQTREAATLAEREKAIKDEIRKSEAEIAEGKQKNLDVTERIKRVDELRGQLSEIDQQRNEDNIRIAELRLKGVDNLSKAEKHELQILEGQTTQKKDALEIAELTWKLQHNAITPEELERLRILTKQTEEIETQNKKLEEQKEKVIEIKTVYGKQQTDLSDRELAEKIQTLSQQIFNNMQVVGEGGSNWTPTRSITAYLERQLKDAREEQALRSRFRRDYASKGDDAFNSYRASDEERLRNYIRPEDEKRQAETATAIKEINDSLKRILKR